MMYSKKSTHKLYASARTQRLGLMLVGLITLTTLPQTAHAQSLTTIFAGNNNNSIGGATFFDLNIAVPNITITSIATNVNNLPGSSVSLEIWTRTGTATGFQAAASGWTLVSTGTTIAAATDLPTMFDVSDFNLGSGVTGVAIRNVNYRARYTTGNGTNQVYSNPHLVVSTGSASNTFLAGGAISTPRVWNGTINYIVAPEPGTLALFALGGVGVLTRRRRK
jgi:PEP-CTERM motif